MAEQKPKRQRLISPRGFAVYPRLTSPDTKFVPEGEYKTSLKMSYEDGQPMMDKLDEMLADAYAAAVTANKGKTFKIVAGKKTEIKTNDPYIRVLDENGEETGEVQFNFTMKASFKTKDGELIKQKPTLVDAKGNEIKGAISVYGGSTIKVNYTPSAYDSNFGVGVKLYLNAVQIIKLVSGGGNHGFGSEADGEDGYEYDGTAAEDFGTDSSDASEDDEF